MSSDALQSKRGTVLCLIESGQASFVWHSAADLLVRPCLFWGPDETRRVLRELESVDGWADVDQQTAGFVLDFDSRRIVYLIHPAKQAPPHAEVLFNRLIEPTWKNYEVVQVDTAAQLQRASDSINGLNTASDSSADLGLSRVSTSGSPLRDSMPTMDWVAVAIDSQSYSHFQELDLVRRIAIDGPAFLESLTPLVEESPDERAVLRGMHVSPLEKQLEVWGWSATAEEWSSLANGFPEWTITTIDDDGFRWQSQRCQFLKPIFASDAELIGPIVLGQLQDPTKAFDDVGKLFRQLSARVFFTGFGCLAVAIGIPFLIMMAITGYWKSGAIMYASMVGFLLLIGSLKFRDIASRMGKVKSSIQGQLVPRWPGPTDLKRSNAELDERLRRVGLPDLDEIRSANADFVRESAETYSAGGNSEFQSGEMGRRFHVRIHRERR